VVMVLLRARRNAILELPTDRSTFAAASVAETRKEVADVTNPRTSASATPDVMAVVTVVPLLSMRILLANSPLAFAYYLLVGLLLIGSSYSACWDDPKINVYSKSDCTGGFTQYADPYNKNSGAEVLVVSVTDGSIDTCTTVNIESGGQVQVSACTPSGSSYISSNYLTSHGCTVIGVINLQKEPTYYNPQRYVFAFEDAGYVIESIYSRTCDAATEVSNSDGTWTCEQSCY